MIYEPCVGIPITVLEIDRYDRIIQAGQPIFGLIDDLPTGYAEFDVRQTTIRYAVYKHGVYNVEPVQKVSELP